MFKDKVQHILKKFNTLMESNLPAKGVISPNGKIFTEAPLYQLDGDVLADQGYIKYNLVRPRFVDLPSANITDIQKLVLQNIIYSMGNDKIAIYSQDNVTAQYFASSKNKIEDILKALKNDDITEAILREGDKKIFDKDSGYNISKDELYIFDKLKKLYPDIQMSYTDDRFVNPETNRHMQLDFYDRSSDTGFNYNKTWTHFSEPYDPENPEHQKDLRWLKSKAEPGNYYERTIRQWTVTDPIKREVAKKNGIRFLEFFNLREFNNWLKDPTQTYEMYKDPNPRRYDSEDYFYQKDILHLDPRGNDSDYLGD